MTCPLGHVICLDGESSVDHVTFDISGSKGDDVTKNLQLARDSRFDGGSAAVVDTIVTASGRFCSSLQSEMVAIDQAPNWLAVRQDWTTARVVT